MGEDAGLGALRLVDGGDWEVGFAGDAIGVFVTLVALVTRRPGGGAGVLLKAYCWSVPAKLAG